MWSWTAAVVTIRAPFGMEFPKRSLAPSQTRRIKDLRTEPR
jgi:hypothetical protein